MRKDGRKIKTIDPMYKLISHIMVERCDSMNMIELTVQQDPIRKYMRRKKDEGYTFSHLAIVLAAFIRTTAEYPFLNRFVVNKNLYARNELTIGMVVLKPGETEGTMNKMFFKPDMTIYQVQEVLDKNRDAIIAANKDDLDAGLAAGMSDSILDRLMLDHKRINGIIASLREVIGQTDPVGEEVAGWKTPNGMNIRQVRVPLGVVALIYENRPNVTVDAFSLAYKSGNAILLRGSSSSYLSNVAIVRVIKEALAGVEGGVPEAIELVEVHEHDHSDVDQILNAVGMIDVCLPRGGKKLIQNVVQNARVPVIETGSGVCHLYVDEFANLEMASRIAENAKIQRPSVCNAIECIVVHSKVAEQFLPMLEKTFAGRVKLHADKKSYEILQNCVVSNRTTIVPATEEDFGNEYLDYECCIKIVDSIQEAIEYINTHNTKHSESIISESRENTRLFQSMIDASCVYVNASTRFTDGGEFGFGAELGISTQKLHARGPMGIKVLTTTKYLIDGEGQIR